VRQRGLPWLAVCLLTAAVWALAVGTGPIVWAGPPAQTVPKATPARTRAPTPTPVEGQPSLPAETLVPPAAIPGLPASGTPAASAQPPVGTPAQSPPAPTVPRESAPTAAWETAEAAVAAPPTLPAPQQCAPAITSTMTVSLPPVTDSGGPVSLAWLILLGVGMMLVGLGLVLVFRKGT
jgi:hypothetical protein